MPIDLVKTLQELVAIPSVNPMGRDVSGPEFLEYRVTDYLQSLFEKLNLPWQRQHLEPKRENILARLDGEISPEQGGKILMFEAHQDTVPVDGMTIEPWNPLIKNGKIQGRGSCDIKGGMSAMLWAFSRLAEERPQGMPTIIMACTVNEEHGYSGATDLARLWEKGAKSIVPRRPDAAVIAEPTSLNVVVAHKGALRWRCRTRGKAAHSSQPQLGQNAIYRMAKVLNALEAFHLQETPKLPPHHLCGKTSLSVGIIRGGLSVNTVPDECHIEIDRRLLPGEKAEPALKQIIDFVASYPGVDFPVEHEKPFLQGLPLADDNNGPLGKALALSAREVIPSCDCIGVPFGTDASKIANFGIPSVVFGPGSIDQAHTADEWLSLDELEKGAEILYRFGKSGNLGG